MTESQLEAVIVTEEEAGQRLDQFLAHRFPSFSRTYFQELIELELVLVNEEPQKKRYLVQACDEVDIEFAASAEPSLLAEPIAFDILYEDAGLLAINKPAGLVVHPGAGNWTGTFVNGLIYYCKNLQEAEGLRPGIVHRLDKDTSGVLLAAKNLEMQQKLVQAFASRDMKKTYLAVCLGNPKNRSCHGRIARHPTKRQQMAIVEKGGKDALTHIKVLQVRHDLATVALFPETGRTHQLRVHLQAAECPILGDAVYGRASANKTHHATRQLLHAYRLEFKHPLTQNIIKITAPLPEDMRPYFDQEVLQNLETFLK